MNVSSPFHGTAMPVSLTKDSDIDVLIIGAVPAGLMCANGLAKAGVKVRIIDKKYFLER
jgi:phenol 2-monooxygenase (NADPH)